MKNLGTIIFMLGLMGALILGPGPASAVIIGFDDIAAGTVIDGVNLGGLTLSTPGGRTEVVNDFGVGYRSPFNAVTNFTNSGNFVTFAPIIIRFDLLQDFVAVVGGDSGGDQDQFTIKAYDDANNLLASFTTPVFGGNPIDPNVMVDFYTAQFDLGSAVIRTLEISDAINAGIGIDNVVFHNVPIPGSVLLMGSGLLGMLGLARKKIWSR
jgi:hypothetical protein